MKMGRPRTGLESLPVCDPSPSLPRCSSLSCLKSTCPPEKLFRGIGLCGFSAETPGELTGVYLRRAWVMWENLFHKWLLLIQGYGILNVVLLKHSKKTTRESCVFDFFKIWWGGPWRCHTGKWTTRRDKNGNEAQIDFIRIRLPDAFKASIIWNKRFLDVIKYNSWCMGIVITSNLNSGYVSFIPRWALELSYLY